jgi:hypothetical protein
MSFCQLVSYVCLQINELCIVCMCGSCGKVDPSLLLMWLSSLLLLFSLHDQNIDWIISDFWWTMMIILFFFFFFFSLTTSRSWLSYVLLSFFLLSFFILLLCLSSSHNYCGMFIHSVGLPPTRLCRNIKTSSSLSYFSKFEENLHWQWSSKFNFRLETIRVGQMV